jgi:hypothetical protein
MLATMSNRSISLGASGTIAAVVFGCGLLACDDSGGSGGGAGTGGNSGAAGSDGAAGGCAANTSFKGQPGTLWVDTNEGDLIQFDSADGHRIKTVPAPGPRDGIVGGNALIWIWSVGTSQDITPMQPSGQALPDLGIASEYYPTFAEGKLWTVGPDANLGPTIYAISNPTSVAKLPTAYATNASAVSSDGFFFLGATSPINPQVEVGHVDPADSTLVWHVSVASMPSMKNWPQTDGEPSMAAIPGKVLVKTPIDIDPTKRYDEIFSIDVATQAVSAPGKLDFNPGNNGLLTLVSDGTGFYVLDDYNAKVYEIDPVSFAAKRTLRLPDDTDEPIHGPLVAAGALWLARQCNGQRYVRRVDLADGTVADLTVPEASANGLNSYAYLPP